MDRFDPPLYAAADPPTVKTEPAGPAPEGESQPDPAAGGETSVAESSRASEPEPEEDTSLSEAGAGIGADAQPPERLHIREVGVAAPLHERPEAPSEHPGIETAAAVPDTVPADAPPESSADKAREPSSAPARSDAHAQASSVEPAAVQAGLVRPDVQISSPADASPARAPVEPPRAMRPLLADWDRARVKSVGVRAAKVGAIVFSAWFTVVLFLIVVYRFVNPPFSSLMVMQWLTGTSIQRQWVSVDRISPNLVRAVIASEDGRFCSHWGIDFAEVAAAIKRTSGGVPRGASTITMQVAKNLFLWPAKSYVRKIIEVPLTYAIELAWPKRRIMEVYLNIAEWGPGVFGAEAASQEHFRRSAAQLNARQAAQLAVALPNPFVRDAGDPGPWTSRRASIIQRRAARSPEEAVCVLAGD